MVDFYGQAERLSFAYSLEAAEYVFLPGYGVTELIPAEGADGDDVYEIVGTSLWNLAMPLVRYRTGDLVRLPPGLPKDDLEPVCYGLTRIAGISGRHDDYLVTPAGGRLMGIDHIPRGVENVIRVQVIQERPDFVRILVVAKRGFGDADRAQIAENARRKIPPEMTVSIEITGALEQTAGGKTPLVVRRPASAPKTQGSDADPAASG